MNRSRSILRKFGSMKTRYFVFGLSLLLLVQVSAQKSLLWKVEKSGSHPSYVFGTFHIFPQDKFVIPEKVKTAMSACEVLTMELDMAPGTEAKMLALAPMKNGQTLDQLLSADDLALLDSSLMVVGMSRVIFNNWKPLLVSSVFYSQYMESGVASFEFALQKIALDEGMKVMGLETVERQMEVFEQVSYADQAQDLMAVLKEREKFQSLFDEMVQGYLDEDVERLLELSNKEMDDIKQIEVFLNARNEEWIPKMKSMMAEQPTFFAVGAGHLGGESGLLKLLKKEGYSVTPMMD